VVSFYFECVVDIGAGVSLVATFEFIVVDVGTGVSLVALGHRGSG